MTSPILGASCRVPGSFRDPAGYVFVRENRIFRAIDDAAWGRFSELQAEGRLARWMQEGRLVRSWRPDDANLLASFRDEHPDYEHFLEHERIAPVTYPYEWPVSMLADAGLHTLQLQLDLLEYGWSLKDATAYNVQFVRGRAVFIDIPSIERPARSDVWHALGQFQQMFTYPLLLSLYCGWDPRSYFMANPQGQSVEKVGRCLGGRRLFDPRLWLDVSLPLWFSGKADRTAPPPTKAAPPTQAGPGDPRALRYNLERLKRKLQKLAQAYRPAGVWADYTQACSYEKSAEQFKKNLIREFLEKHRPRSVLDLGSNTGDYSFLAAATGARVISVDSDHDAVELLYRRLQETPADISPVVGDLTSPSPGLGFRNEERTAFLERAPSDCVLALALLHHLLVSGNLPLAMIRDQLADLTRDLLVLEFVPPTDPMFARLTRHRTEKYESLTLEQVRASLAARFEVLDERALPESPRTLLFLRVLR